MKLASNIVIGLDHGAGAWKVFGPHGGIELPSSVATNGRTTLGKVAGLRSRKPPLCVKTANGAFYVGREAHTWGRPQENLDDIRFAGSPEAVALMNGAFTLYAQHYGPFSDPLTVYVGVPQEAIIGDKAKAIPTAIKKWLTGAHTWRVDDQPYTIAIEKVLITSQPAGALFDYLLDESGRFIAARQHLYQEEVGVISVGMSTVELLVVQQAVPNQRFTLGKTAGVRRLLELLNPHGHYSRGEMDDLLRAGALPYAEKLPIWQGEVLGLVEETWGNAWERFGAIIIVGGGALLLHDALTRKFAGKGIVPEDPVLATARGLFKMGLMQARRQSSQQAGE